MWAALVPVGTQATDRTFRVTWVSVMSYDVTSTDNIFNSPGFQISSVLSSLLATVKNIFYAVSFDINYSLLHDCLEESVIHLPPSVPQWIPSPP